ncbi:nucleolar and coiled-body phosphoprotein 1-like [Hyposmocoma kahamanoa]|uniref:nucleolar and coiled-body phosphoprotein 1-like n=1 Tax=Hyposmocoma kahamanoa TaxID=1477025 RepID=UPI000E6D5F00|nr:nucleolar and coiled-body phosphoprotein 1-like [Hyposmocoma kahamanoa]
MSIFNELLPKLFEISKSSEKSINDELQAALKYLDKLADAYENGRGNIREKTFRNKTRITALQSINEDDGETRKTPENKDNEVVSTSENQPRRVSNKRSKDEVEGMSSPEVDKRQKRNASVKAQSNISKQVNVNLVQKLRREEVSEKSRGRRRKDDDKENSEPIPAIQIKQEKISILEPMESECLPTDVPVKQEPAADQAVMPPPVAPVPKTRKAAPPKASSESSEEETGSSRRRTARRKPADVDADAMPPPKPGTRLLGQSPHVSEVASARSTRASSRAKLADEKADDEAPRTRKTRARKKVSESSSVENEKPPEESALASPVEKRPKRTKRGQKAAEKEQQKPDESQSKPIETISLKEERITQTGPSSPILPVKEKSKTNLKKSDEEKLGENKQNESKVQTEESNSKPQKESKIPKQNSNDKKKNKSKKEIAEQQKELVVSNDIAIDETKMIVNDKMNVTVTINNEMDRTMVLPIGVYNHAPVTPTNICNNETVVIETCRETIVLEKHTQVNDATVVIDKEPTTNVTDDNSSILTEDNSAIDEEPQTPPKPIPTALPTSAVKEKVQQFEELASRTTRTKTRAMAKLVSAPPTPGTPAQRPAPVHMADGFELLNSDSDDEAPPAPKVVPAWSTSRARKEALLLQAGVAAAHVDRLFGLRRHNPDLRDIFPSIARHRLQRTSSAVWRTPPRLPPRPPLPALLD